MRFSTLRDLKPLEFEQAADGYRLASDAARAAKDRIEQQIVVRIRASLAGEAVTAAVKELQEIAKNFHYTQVECGLVSTALNGLAFDLNAAQRKLDNAVADAQAEGMTVNPDGSVTYPPGGKEVDGKLPAGGTATGLADTTAGAVADQAANFDPNPHARRAQDYANRIAAAVNEATEADAKWAPKILALQADDDLVVSDRDWADAEGDMAGVRRAADAYLDTIKPPPKDGSPETNAAWWKSLSAEQRAEYITTQPNAVGALDGLPAEVRDEANRTVLAETRGRYQTALDSIPKEPAMHVDESLQRTPEWMEWNSKYADEKRQLESRIQGMDAIQERLNSTGISKNGSSLPEAYLLGFDADANSDGRVILTNGNPDTADHTAVFVPGTKTKLEGIGDEIADMDALWRQSQRLAPGQEVSTITWFDYNAPDNVIPQATRGMYAEDAAPALRHFLDGNEVAHNEATGEPSHRTLIGHSYGSTVVGETAVYTPDYAHSPWTDSMPVDDIVVLGSPGMQASHAADLGFKPDHFWAMAGGGDDHIVREGGRLVGLGDDATIPTDPEFGANLMESDAGGHGAFWDEGTDGPSLSLENQARVVAGQYGEVTLEREAQ